MTRKLACVAQRLRLTSSYGFHNFSEVGEV
jgi:hypothetical protein